MKSLRFSFMHDRATTTLKCTVCRFIAVAVLCATSTTVYAKGSSERSDSKELPPIQKIAVFIPGIISGSPIYEMLAFGARKAANEREDAEVIFVEAGTNQSQWLHRITAIAATENYDVIISSNPSLPSICAEVSKNFPHQKFIIMNSHLSGNPAIATIRYNQREQAYTAGYMAGLATTSSMPHANQEKKIGLIAAQEYPDMNDCILPAYLEGAHAVDPEITLDFRVIGNWYDGAKAAEIAAAMVKDGVDVILPISGGANQGVITAAQELGFYIVWFDDNGYSKAPGYVIGSAVVVQNTMSYEQTIRYLDGRTDFGKAITVGFAEGYINFIDNDPLYESSVPEEIRKRQSEMLTRLRNGELQLPVGN